MLKIYNAIGTSGKIVLKKGIELINKKFNIEEKGCGTIVSTRNCQKADYLVEDLEQFKRYIFKITKNEEWGPTYYGASRILYGIQNASFPLKNLYSKEELEVFQCMKELPKRLDEEGILLFTNDIILSYYHDRKIEKVLGHYNNTGAYILLPGARLGINSLKYRENQEELDVYEVLESSSTPKQLYLTKTDRIIME